MVFLDLRHTQARIHTIDSIVWLWLVDYNTIYLLTVTGINRPTFMTITQIEKTVIWLPNFIAEYSSWVHFDALRTFHKYATKTVFGIFYPPLFVFH